MKNVIELIALLRRKICSDNISLWFEEEIETDPKLICKRLFKGSKVKSWVLEIFETLKEKENHTHKYKVEDESVLAIFIQNVKNKGFMNSIVLTI